MKSTAEGRFSTPAISQYYRLSEYRSGLLCCPRIAA